MNLFNKKNVEKSKNHWFKADIFGQMGHTLNKKKWKSQKFGTRWDWPTTPSIKTKINVKNSTNNQWFSDFSIFFFLNNYYFNKTKKHQAVIQKKRFDLRAKEKKIKIHVVFSMYIISSNQPVNVSFVVFLFPRNKNA